MVHPPGQHREQDPDVLGGREISLVSLAGQYREHGATVEKLLKLVMRTSPSVPRLPGTLVPQQQLRLTSERVDQLVDAYRGGGTIKALAVEYGIHHTTVMRHLDKRGITDRQRGGRSSD